MRRKATTLGKDCEKYFEEDFLKPSESIIASGLHMTAASWNEQWESFDQPQCYFLNDAEKYISR